MSDGHHGPPATGEGALDPLQRRVLRAALAMQRKSWEQGVLGHAVLDLRLGSLVPVMARDAVQLQTEAGQLGTAEEWDLVNGAAAGEVVLAAFQGCGSGSGSGLRSPSGADPSSGTESLLGAESSSGPDGNLRQGLDRQLTWLDHAAPRAADGTLFHLGHSAQVWVDTVYMVVPLLARCGRFAAAQAQLDGHRRRLFDPASGLYAHQWDESSGSLSRAAHWGSGSGWVIAGIARALHHLPAHVAAGGFWRETAEHACCIIDSCLRYRAASGRFHDVVDDPDSFEEVNLAQMLAYSIFTGVADGWLPPSRLEHGRSLTATAREHVDTQGLVVPVCGAPRFDRPGSSVEAQAFFLLATTAERRCNT